MIIGVQSVKNIEIVPLIDISYFVRENLLWQILEYFILSPLQTEKLFRRTDISAAFSKTSKATSKNIIDLLYLLCEQRFFSILKEFYNFNIRNINIFMKFCSHIVNKKISLNVSS